MKKSEDDPKKPEKNEQEESSKLENFAAEFGLDADSESTPEPEDKSVMYGGKYNSLEAWEQRRNSENANKQPTPKTSPNPTHIMVGENSPNRPGTSRPSNRAGPSSSANTNPTPIDDDTHHTRYRDYSDPPHEVGHEDVAVDGNNITETVPVENVEASPEEVVAEQLGQNAEEENSGESGGFFSKFFSCF
ncbi:unnamed protein product [Caenorhabditis angaria]|uniref:Uncharacterized protein n=1 Tax=Caenorhabditis angaria TaxID=860376 RepID=A0A9P1IPP1_9PELO|nr:unnamed protein product [Caenorhabditis angaria]